MSIIIISRLVWVQLRPIKPRIEQNLGTEKACKSETNPTNSTSPTLLVDHLIKYSCSIKSLSENKKIVLIAFLLSGLIAKLLSGSWTICILLITILISGSRPLFLSEVSGPFNYITFTTVLWFFFYANYLINPHIINLFAISIIGFIGIYLLQDSFLFLLTALLLSFMYSYFYILFFKQIRNNHHEDYLTYSSNNSLYSINKEFFFSWIKKGNRARDQLISYCIVLLSLTLITYLIFNLNFVSLQNIKDKLIGLSNINFLAKLYKLNEIIHLRYKACLLGMMIIQFIPCFDSIIKKYSKFVLTIYSISTICFILEINLLFQTSYIEYLNLPFFYLEMIAYTCGISCYWYIFNYAYQLLYKKNKLENKA